jgi:hypothetical protein
MPFNWPLLLLVVATSGVVLALAFVGIFFLNRVADKSERS